MAQSTRQYILAQALETSSEVGLEGISIGTLAKKVGMSKSGLFAHFHSKQALQCAVLDTAAQRFVDDVVAPALKMPRGVPRIKALFDYWLQWETQTLSGGCPFIAASTEFDDRPGAVRDALVSHFRDLMGAMHRAADIAVEEGHFQTDLDVGQFAYELWAILLAYHHFSRLMNVADARERAESAFSALLLRSGRQGDSA